MTATMKALHIEGSGFCNGCYYINDEDGNTVAEIYAVFAGHSAEQALQLANLIVAAPEMLSMLKRLYAWLDGIGDGAPDASRTQKEALNEAALIRHLLAKAKGESRT